MVSAWASTFLNFHAKSSSRLFANDVKFIWNTVDQLLEFLTLSNEV